MEIWGDVICSFSRDGQMLNIIRMTTTRIKTTTTKTTKKTNTKTTRNIYIFFSFGSSICTPPEVELSIVCEILATEKDILPTSQMFVVLLLHYKYAWCTVKT